MVLPILAGAGIAVAGAGLLAKAFDKDDPTHIATYGVDAKDYGYGYGGYASDLGHKADAMADRNAYVMNFDQANADYAAANQIRQEQLALGSHYRDVLAGKAPSVTEQQLRMGQEKTNMAAAQLAASARGGNVALAQMEAQRQAALGGQEVNAQAALARLKEQQMARGEYASLLSGTRQQDYTSRGQSQTQTGMVTQNEQFQRQLNQSGELAYAGLQQQAYNQDSQAGQAYGQAKQSAHYGSATHNANANAQKNAQDNAFYGSLMNTGAGLAEKGFTSSGKKKDDDD